MLITYPHVFLDGPQALIVSSALDPDVLLDELAHRGYKPKLWTAKITGVDTGGLTEIVHGFNRARARGLHVGGWIQCGKDPKSDIQSVSPWVPLLEYVGFCCEIEYKQEPYLADELVGYSNVLSLPKALISYGKLDLQIRNEVFAKAGWAVCPEAYDAFVLAQAESYVPTWPGRAVHPLQRQIPPDKYRGNMCGVYRPEGLL